MRKLAGCGTERRQFAWRGLARILLILGLSSASPANAQVAANVTVATSNIFRGESTSGDDAATSVELSYDHPSGLFGGASVTATGGQHDPHFNAATQYAGYALRLGDSSIELGVIHRDYDARSVFDEAYSPHYVEGFVGISHRSLKLRFYVSPNYLRDGGTTYYGELEGRLIKLGEWSLRGHGGVSVVPPEPGETGMRDYYDLSLQAGRSFGKFSLSLGVATTNYPVFAPDEGPGLFRNKPRVFASLSRAF
jgi:uncharacterized protein (TIGR02001 family)